MLKKIAGTVATRLIIAIFSFLIVIIAAKYLGAEKYGSISLLLVGIALTLLINNFIGGGALVYLATRENNINLLVPSYIWAIITAIIGTLLLIWAKKIPEELKIHLLVLSLIQSFNSININTLLGHEKIKQVNIISLVQTISFFIVFCILIFLIKANTFSSYIISLYVSYSLPFITGCYFLKEILVSFPNRIFSFKITLRIFNFGKYIQLANFAQFFNYRLNYYIIEFFLGRGALGVYTAGNQISEGMWFVSKSMSMVQYSRISNEKDIDYARLLTIKLLKFSFIITLLIILTALLIPSKVYIMLFGEDFSMIKLIILSLGVGILSISLSTLFSSYFSGTGKPFHNTIASIIGLVVTLTLGFIFIPKFGIIAAAIIASTAYFSSVIYQIIVFIKTSNSKIKEFIPHKDDFIYLRSELKQLLNN